MLSHVAKYRIKAWSARILFVVAFFCLPFLPFRLGYFWPLIPVLPGALVMSLLWPSVLASKELTPQGLHTTRVISAVFLMIVAGVCLLLTLYA